MKTKILRSVVVILGGMALPLLVVSGALAANNMTFQDEVDVEFTFEPTLSVTLGSGTIATEVAPGNYSYSEDPLHIEVTTNSLSGYALYARVGGDGETVANNSLIQEVGGQSVGAAFVSIASSRPLSDFADNTWGYAVTGMSAEPTVFSGLKYGSVESHAPVDDGYDTKINATKNITGTKESDDFIGGNEMNFWIGAKAADTQVAGEYKNVITFTVVANVPPKTLADITNMQEMVPEICDATSTPLASDGANTPQYRLRDTRDNKYYWVAKLADGNCWMTQNLDLDIPAAGLSASDTDITSDWNSSSDRPPVATLIDASQYTNNDDTTSTASWDAGNWYYDGTSSTSCGSGKTTYEGCTGFSNTGDAHRHVGNMYSWGAATAGSGGAITSGQAQDSICPKGWRLPMSSGNPSFANLQTAGSLGSTVQNWLNAPYYFTRTGELWYDSDELFDAGYSGGYWSSTPYSTSSYAYDLVYPYLYPDFYSNRAVGLSVRCVAGS